MHESCKKGLLYLHTHMRNNFFTLDFMETPVIEAKRRYKLTSKDNEDVYTELIAHRIAQPKFNL